MARRLDGRTFIQTQSFILQYTYTYVIRKRGNVLARGLKISPAQKELTAEMSDQPRPAHHCAANGSQLPTRLKTKTAGETFQRRAPLLVIIFLHDLCSLTSPE